MLGLIRVPRRHSQAQLACGDRGSNTHARAKLSRRGLGITPPSAEQATRAQRRRPPIPCHCEHRWLYRATCHHVVPCVPSRVRTHDRLLTPLPLSSSNQNRDRHISSRYNTRLPSRAQSQSSPHISATSSSSLNCSRSAIISTFLEAMQSGLSSEGRGGRGTGQISRDSSQPRSPPGARPPASPSLRSPESSLPTLLALGAKMPAPMACSKILADCHTHLQISPSPARSPNYLQPRQPVTTRGRRGGGVRGALQRHALSTLRRAESFGNVVHLYMLCKP